MGLLARNLAGSGLTAKRIALQCPRAAGHCSHGWFSIILKGIEVHFTAETEKKLKNLTKKSGRGSADKLMQVLVEGYIDELAQAREMLNSRYDDLKSGKVKLIPGDRLKPTSAKRAPLPVARDSSVHNRMAISPRVSRGEAAPPT